MTIRNSVVIPICPTFFSHAENCSLLDRPWVVPVSDFRGGNPERESNRMTLPAFRCSGPASRELSRKFFREENRFILSLIEFITAVRVVRKWYSTMFKSCETPDQGSIRALRFQQP
jgi:hypothetical protein